MQTKQRVIVLIVNVVCWATTVGTYAQDASKLSEMSDRQPCRIVEELLPRAQARLLWGEQLGASSASITGVYLTGSVITLKLSRTVGEMKLCLRDPACAQQARTDWNLDIAYKEIERAELHCGPTGLKSPWPAGHRSNSHSCEIKIPTEKYKNTIYDLSQISEAQAAQLAKALNQLITDAHEGRTSCMRNPDDQKAELAAFEQKTAAWRAMATKPVISDEVYKYRLLAEDALKNKDMDGALSYYEAGVAADPTWAQGWYNAALLYAEQKDYFDAAYCMKHYVILVPDASDAQTAKDNIILWEAKAQRAKP